MENDVRRRTNDGACRKLLMLITAGSASLSITVSVRETLLKPVSLELSKLNFSLSGSDSATNGVLARWSRVYDYKLPYSSLAANGPLTSMR